jgi:hypothetical protein
MPTKSALTGGGTYRITINRTASNGADTLASAIGLVGVMLKPSK